MEPIEVWTVRRLWLLIHVHQSPTLGLGHPAPGMEPESQNLKTVSEGLPATHRKSPGRPDSTGLTPLRADVCHTLSSSRATL